MFGRDWIRVIVAAATGERIQFPISFNELQDGNVVGVAVDHVAWQRVRGNSIQRNSRAIAEEIEGLHVAGIVVTAAFIDRDQNGRALPERWNVEQGQAYVLMFSW